MNLLERHREQQAKARKALEDERERLVAMLRLIELPEFAQLEGWLEARLAMVRGAVASYAGGAEVRQHLDLILRLQGKAECLRELLSLRETVGREAEKLERKLADSPSPARGTSG